MFHPALFLLIGAVPLLVLAMAVAVRPYNMRSAQRDG